MVSVCYFTRSSPKTVLPKQQVAYSTCKRRAARYGKDTRYENHGSRPNSWLILRMAMHLLQSLWMGMQNIKEKYRIRPRTDVISQKGSGDLTYLNQETLALQLVRDHRQTSPSPDLRATFRWQLPWPSRVAMASRASKPGLQNNALPIWQSCISDSESSISETPRERRHSSNSAFPVSLDLPNRRNLIRSITTAHWA